MTPPAFRHIPARPPHIPGICPPGAGEIPTAKVGPDRPPRTGRLDRDRGTGWGHEAPPGLRRDGYDRRSTIMAMPWPPPTHIVSSP